MGSAYDQQPLILRYKGRLPWYVEWISPNRAEDRAGARVMVAACADRGRRAAWKQFHKLWSGTRAPYAKSEWGKLHSMLSTLKFDVPAPVYALETTSDLVERLGVLDAKSKRWQVGDLCILVAGILDFIVVLGTRGSTRWHTADVASLWGLAVLFVLGRVLLPTVKKCALRELRFELALFCEHCGAAFTGDYPPWDHQVLATGCCPECHGSLYDSEAW